MSEEREPFPTEDPRGTDVSDQNTEEQHPAGTEGGDSGQGRPKDAGPSPDAPDTSHDEEGDSGQATGNPRSAG